MTPARNSELHVVYLDKREFALCCDRAEALRLSASLLDRHHAKRIAILHA